MSGHPIDDDDLIAYAFGDLSPERLSEVSAHVASCVACATSIARFHLVHDTLRGDTLATPSAAALDGVRRLTVGLPRPKPERRAWFLDTARRLSATLAFDGRQATAMAGLRGKEDAYLLSYEEQRGRLDLHIEPPGGDLDARWLVTGQLSMAADGLPADLAIVPIENGNSLLPIVTSTDEYGVFTVDLAPGRYEILVDVADGVLVFTGIDTE